MSGALLPFSTVISRAPADDELVNQYQYRPNFLSSDLPSEADDDFLTPRPASRGQKRDFVAYSSDNEDVSLSQASNPSAQRWHKRRQSERRRRPIHSGVNFQAESVKHAITQAIEESLTTIHLGSRNLTYLPDEVGDLRHVTSLTPSKARIQLFLEKNRLTSLPESLFDVTNLEFLGLSANRLTSLSPSIAKLTNLKSLNIGLNHIDYLPAALLDMHWLEHLVFHSAVIQPSPARSAHRTSSTLSLGTPTAARGDGTAGALDMPTPTATPSTASTASAAAAAAALGKHKTSTAMLETPPRTIYPYAHLRPANRGSRVPSLTELLLRHLAEDQRWQSYIAPDLAHDNEDDVRDHRNTSRHGHGHGHGHGHAHDRGHSSGDGTMAAAGAGASLAMEAIFADLCGPRLLDLVKSPLTPCDTCGTCMVQVYAVREELWTGFAHTEGLPIRRNLCGPNCLERAPQYLP